MTDAQPIYRGQHRQLVIGGHSHCYQTSDYATSDEAEQHVRELWGTGEIVKTEDRGKTWAVVARIP
jgi:hypothetical protein